MTQDGVVNPLEEQGKKREFRTLLRSILQMVVHALECRARESYYNTAAKRDQMLDGYGAMPKRTFLKSPVKSAGFTRQSSIPFPDAVIDQHTNASVWPRSRDSLDL